MPLPSTEGLGFHWSMEPVMKKDMDLGQVPIPVVDDVVLYETKFPGRLIQAVNGQSIRVTGQRIARDMKWEDRGTTDEAIAKQQLAWMSGARKARSVVTVERRIYVASDGTEFDTKEELLTYEHTLA